MTFRRSSILALAGVALLASGGVADAQRKKNKKSEPALFAPGRSTIATPEQVPPPPPPKPTTTVAQGVMQLPGHASLARLLTVANLNGELSGPGPFTLFAPNDAAFSRLPAGTVDNLVKPEYAATLISILKYHIVPGELTIDEIKDRVEQGGGTAQLQTLQGGTFSVTMTPEGAVQLTDANGNVSYVNQPETEEANGVIQGVNGVIGPKAPPQPAAPSPETPADGS